MDEINDLSSTYGERRSRPALWSEKSEGSELLEVRLADKGMMLAVILETQACGMKICLD